MIPTFFKDGTPGASDAWISIMKESIRVGVTGFNTERMLSQYVKEMYTHLG